MLAELQDTLTHPDGVVMRARRGRPTGAGRRAALLDWDSQFFGVPMGRIEYVLRASDAALLPRRSTPPSTTLRARGVRHVSARVDVADIEHGGGRSSRAASA